MLVGGADMGVSLVSSDCSVVEVTDASVVTSLGGVVEVIVDAVVPGSGTFVTSGTLSQLPSLTSISSMARSLEKSPVLPLIRTEKQGGRLLLATDSSVHSLGAVAVTVVDDPITAPCGSTNATLSVVFVFCFM